MIKSIFGRRDSQAKEARSYHVRPRTRRGSNFTSFDIQPPTVEREQYCLENAVIEEEDSVGETSVHSENPSGSVATGLSPSSCHNSYHSRRSSEPVNTVPKLSYTPLPDEADYYEYLFIQADVSNNGHIIPTNEAHSFFKRSQIPGEKLDIIIGMAASVNALKHVYNRKKFNVVIRLIQLQQNGAKLKNLNLEVDEIMERVKFEGVSMAKFKKVVTREDDISILSNSSDRRRQVTQELSDSIRDICSISTPPLEDDITKEIEEVDPFTEDVNDEDEHDEEYDEDLLVSFPSVERRLSTKSEKLPSVRLITEQEPEQSCSKADALSESNPALFTESTGSLDSTQQNNTSSEGQEEYNIITVEKCLYEDDYEKYKSQNNGAESFISFTSSSRLNEWKTRYIYHLVASDKAKLLKGEFIIAMHLVTCVSDKKLPLPRSLPDSLLSLRDEYKEGNVHSKNCEVNNSKDCSKLGTETGDVKECVNCNKLEERCAKLEDGMAEIQELLKRTLEQVESLSKEVCVLRGKGSGDTVNTKETDTMSDGDEEEDEIMNNAVVVSHHPSVYNKTIIVQGTSSDEHNINPADDCTDALVISQAQDITTNEGRECTDALVISQAQDIATNEDRECNQTIGYHIQSEELDIDSADDCTAKISNVIVIGQACEVPNAATEFNDGDGECDETNDFIISSTEGVRELD